MATQTILMAGVAGTDTIKVYSQSNGALVDSQSASAFGANPTAFTADFTDLPAASYDIVSFVGALAAISDTVTTTAATATFAGDTFRSAFSAQAIRDAMKLAPSAGDPAAGSIDKHLDDIVVPTTNSITVTATNYGQSGSSLSLKRGLPEALQFDLMTAVTMSHVVFGICDNSGRYMLPKLAGTKTTSTQLNFTIGITEALLLIPGVWNYDVWELDNYVASTGVYTDANLVVSGPVTIDQMYARLKVG